MGGKERREGEGGRGKSEKGETRKIQGREWERRREEENARLEREAHWLERIAGRNLSRRGDFPQL